MPRPRLTIPFLSKTPPPEPPAVPPIDCQVITTEVEAIKEQVEQARHLLADAIVKLGDSFSRLETDTSAQRTVMDNLLANLSWTRGAPTSGGKEASGDISIRQFASETTAVLRQFTELLASVSGQSIKTVYRIDDMAQELEEIFKLVANINEIASETFMLAVNATIAAAHAGPAGRAFSVIAGNVRELSKKTRRFNDQIGLQIGKAQATVNEVRLIIGQMASRDLNVALASKERVQSMLSDLERFEQLVMSSVDQSNAATTRIADATSSAITALQFEDIMTQLMATIGRRADRIGRATSAPGAMGVSRAAEDLPPLPASRTAEGAVADPVRQRSMDPGEVELF